MLHYSTTVILEILSGLGTEIKKSARKKDRLKHVFPRLLIYLFFFLFASRDLKVALVDVDRHVAKVAARE